MFLFDDKIIVTMYIGKYSAADIATDVEIRDLGRFSTKHGIS